MDADSSMLAHPLPSVLLVAVVFLLFGIPLAHGQAHQGEGIAEEGQNELTQSSQLPDWAEPSTGTSNEQSTNDVNVNDQMRTRQPDLPNDPEQVPVDGGLALLAAAGAGYAVRRLNQEEKDEFEE